MTTLGDLRRLPGWRSTVERHAGPDGEDRAVSAVALVPARPDALAERPGADDLVLDGDQAAWRWDALLRAAVDREATALVVPASIVLPPPSRALAERLGVTVLRLAADVELTALAAEAIERTAAPEAAAGGLASAFAQQSVTGRREAAQLLDEAAQLAGVCAWAWLPGRPDPVVSHGFGEAPVPAPSPVADGRVREVRHGSVTVVQLAVEQQAGVLTAGLVDLSPADLDAGSYGPLLQVLGLALRDAISRDRLAAESRARSARDLLEELLLAPQLTPPLERRADAAGFPLVGWMLGFVLVIDPDLDPVLASDRLATELGEKGWRTAVVPRAEVVTGWMVLGQPDAATRSRAESALREVLVRVDGSAETAAGIGSPVRGLEGLGRSLAEARDAADLAMTRPAGARVVQVDALGMGATIRSWTSSSGFRASARQRLAAIADQPELVTTLQAYLDQALEVTATAHALAIHRNTVMSRVARIEALLGVTLTDPDDRLALHLAVRALSQGDS